MFGSKFTHFCFSNQTNLRVLILNVPIAFFKVLSKNTQIRYLWSLIYTFLFFRKLLQKDKVEGAYFKYYNSFSKLQPKNTQIRYFFQKFRYLCFYTKFCNYRKLRVLISNITIVFLKIQPKNTQLRYVWFQIYPFLFCRKIFHIRQI